MRSRIARVTAHVLEARLDEPWDFGIEPYRTSTCVVVEVEAESGARGYGEAIARKTPRTTATLVEDLLRPLAVGRPVTDAGRIWFEAVSSLRRWGHSRGFLLEAIAGLDIALWDLRAREADVPIGALLPYGRTDEVTTYASSIYFQPSVEDAVSLAERTVAGGVARLKVKIGHRAEQGGLRRDIDTVRSIAEALPDTELMLDANGVYTFADARILVEALGDLGIRWLEEPFPPDDLAAYRALAAVSAIPLAAGESEFSVFGFRDLVTTGSIAFAQPDIARCGGFTGALQIADLCYAHHVPVCPHTGFSGGINNLAALHLTAGVLEPGPLEHMIIGNPLRDLFTEPLPEPEDGVMAVVDGPGLGREVDPGKLAAFEPRPDPEVGGGVPTD